MEISKLNNKERTISTAIVGCLLLGFLIGIGLLVIWLFAFATIKFRDTLNISYWLFVTTVTILILLLCYNRNVRCVLTLAIPILCSSKGRSLVIALAFIFAALGPVRNILRNLDVLAASLSCGQMRLKEALGDMLDVMKQPLVAIKEMVMMAMHEVQKVMTEVEQILYKVQELVLVLVASIRNAFDWLDSIVSVCNKEFGTPFERCRKVATEAMATCREKLGYFSALCNVGHVFGMLCYSVKFIDVICVLVVFFNDAIIDSIMNSLKLLKKELKELFDVSISFDHDFYFKTVSSQELSDVGANILSDIHNSLRGLILVFSYLDLIGSLLIGLVIIKAIYFRAKYLRNTAYQNRYITKDFIAIDSVRARNQQELALPLTSSEKRKYVKLSGCRITRAECLQVARNGLFLTISTLHLFSLCFADYSLYWMLAVISYHCHKQGAIEVPPYITVDVAGDGKIADIYKGIVHAFEPLTMTRTYNATLCLPLPHRPSFKRYTEIAALCATAWLLLVGQPYGLRLRHVVMRFYYPDVARERATWLYDQILLKRMTFLKFARRKVRAKWLHDRNVDDFSCLDWLRAKTNRLYVCRCLLGRGSGARCVVCSTPLSGGDKHVCETRGCRGVYCPRCYSDSRNTCCLCQKPIDYGDMSDISEVQDSSDEREQPLEVRVIARIGQHQRHHSGSDDDDGYNGSTNNNNNNSNTANNSSSLNTISNSNQANGGSSNSTRNYSTTTTTNNINSTNINSTNTTNTNHHNNNNSNSNNNPSKPNKARK